MPQNPIHPNYHGYKYSCTKQESGTDMTELIYKWIGVRYPISQPIRCTFFSEKCDLNFTCVLCAEGKFYFQTYIPVPALSENNHEDDFSGSDDNLLGYYDE
jgi:hypothetical protein